MRTTIHGVVGALTMAVATTAAAVPIENDAYDLAQVNVDPLWAQTGAGSVVGNTITLDLTFIRSDLGVDGANDWLVEAVINSNAPPGAGEAGARFWVQARTDLCAVDTDQAQWILVHVTRDAGTGRFVGIYDQLGNLKNQTVAAGGGPAEINLTAAATPNGWQQASPRFRIRLMRQGNIIHLQAEPSDSFAPDPTYPDVEVELTLANFPPIPNGAIINIAQVGFGNAHPSGGANNQNSNWEQIHVTSTNDATTVLPYQPAIPPAPTLTFDDKGTGILQGIDFSVDLTTSGYLLSDSAFGELDADGTTYSGAVRVNPGIELWNFDNLGDSQPVNGRVVVMEASGRSTTGPDGTGNIPDRTAPVVASIVRADASPTGATTVSFTVTLSEDVTGVDAADFEVIWTTGAGTGSVSTATEVAPDTYTVTVDTVSGDGTLRLDVVATPTINDLAGNALAGPYASGEEYIILDTVVPTVTSIVRADASPTNAPTINFEVTFSEDVTGVATTDFVVTTAGTATGSVSMLSPVSASAYTVTVDGVSGDGTVRLDLVDFDTIADLFGNPLGGVGAQDYTSGEVYTIDNTAPTAPTVVGTTPTTNTTPTWSWTSGGGGNGSYRYGWAEGTWIAQDVVDIAFTPGAALGDGTYTLFVQERDQLANWSASGSFTIEIDTAAPGAAVVTGNTPTTNTTPTWSWTSGGGGNGSYRYGWAEGTWIAQDVLDIAYTPGVALGDGTYTLFVQERDDAGNWSTSGSFSIEIDTAAPGAAVVTGNTPTTNTTPTWSWTSGGGGNGSYRYGWAEGTWIAQDVLDIAYTPGAALGDGAHTLFVQERDDAGNWSTSGSFAIEIDTAAPGAPVVTGNTPTANTTPTWSWTSGGGGNGSYRYGWAEGTWIAQDILDIAYTPGAALGDGAHTLFVQERDDAGNWSTSGSFSITVEAAAPDDIPPDGGGKNDGGCACGATSSSTGHFTLLVLGLAILKTKRRRRASRVAKTRASRS